MYIEEFGKENEKIIVMLHGANFVHTFAKQYELAQKYHLIIPHLMGYGNETDVIFDSDKQVELLANYISSLGQKVLVIGFSLGAQVGFKLVSEHPTLFSAAILVSPWLDKNEAMLEYVMKQNEKQFALFKKKWICNFIGFVNGMPKNSRKEFVNQMQKVSIETIKKSVDSHITLENARGFSSVPIPVYALAGGKEQDEVKNSVIKMAEMNSNCKYEIWKKAAHNIPIVCSKQFNELIVKIMGETV